jgi:O-methyltransferase
MIHKRRAAAKIWPKYSVQLDAFNRNAKLAEWHRTYMTGPHFNDRTELHRFVASQVVEPLDYLEFGVFQGASLRLWCELARSTETRFFGFDTFTGLPEKWELGRASLQQGHFAVDRMPDLGDARVTLLKGLFQDTLPAFLRTFKRHGAIVVHCDADLYSSTLYCLTRLSEVLQPKDIVIFDEFSQPLHEFRALEDWSSAYRIRYRGVGSSEDYHRQVAIQIVD